MVNPRPHSIRWQLLVMATSVLLLIAVITLWAAKLYGHRAAQLSYDRLLTGAALQIAENINVRNGDISIDLPRSAFETLSLAADDRVFYSIASSNRELITGYSDLPTNQVDPEHLMGFNNSGQTTPVFYDKEYSGEPVRFLVLRKLLTEADFTDEIEIQLGQTVNARNQLATEISLRAFQFVAISFLITLAVILLGIWLVVRPLKKLNQALEERSPVDLSPIEVSVPQEIEPLLSSINRFMLQLGNTLDQLKSFTSVAAHQIRTPLAGLKSQAQNALDEHDDLKRQDQLQRVVECSDLLTGTVSQLLNQAVLAHRFQSQALAPLSLDELCKEVCRDVAVSAIQQGIEVAYLGEQKAYIKGDDFALKQMIRNILENAIKYSPSGSCVEVDIQFKANTLPPAVKLRISDEGPGIPDTEKRHVFERFYRSPENPRSGSGLGLSIAREVAIHHFAILKLVDNKPSGLVVEISFPVIEEPQS